MYEMLVMYNSPVSILFGHNIISVIISKMAVKPIYIIRKKINLLLSTIVSVALFDNMDTMPIIY